MNLHVDLHTHPSKHRNSLQYIFQYFDVTLRMPKEPS